MPSLHKTTRLLSRSSSPLSSPLPCKELDESPKGRDPTQEQVEKFLTITLKIHKVFMNSYPNSFTGKEAVTFLCESFLLSKSESIDFGNLLLRGNIIKPLNNRFNGNFSGRSNYIYHFSPKEKHDLFWLKDNGISEDAGRNPLLKDSGDDDGDESKFIPMDKLTTDRFRKVKRSSPYMCSALQMIGSQLCTKHEEILRVTLPDSTQAIFVFSPALNQLVLEDRKNFAQVRKENPALSPFLIPSHGEHIPLNENQMVLQGSLFKLLHQAMGSGAPGESYIPLMVQVMENELSSLKEQNSVDICLFLQKTIMQMFMGIFFGSNASSTEKNSKFNILPTKSVKSLHTLRSKKLMKQLSRNVDLYLGERTGERGERSLEGDLLQSLIDASYKDEFKCMMSSEEINTTIKSCIITVLLHACKATASMVTWATNFLYDSSLGGNILEALINEIDGVSQRDASFIPTVESFNQTPILTGVFMETLRLTPPIPGVSRIALEDCMIGDYGIPAGTIVIVSITGTHLHPKVWKNPQQFDPYRFFMEDEKRNIEPYSYLPWSGGIHLCGGGMHFPMVMAQVTLMMTMTRYNMKLSPRASIKEDQNLYSIPSGVLLQIRPRKTPVGVTPVERSPSNSFSDPPRIKQTGRAWEGLRSIIKRGNHQIRVVSGTNQPEGKTHQLSIWFTEMAAEFQFEVGESPFTPDDILPLLEKPNKDYLLIGFCLATYQGRPSDNAVKFYKWMEEMKRRIDLGQLELKQHLKGLHYFVFGLGDSQWVGNYQKVPIFVDDVLSLLGARRLCDRGVYDKKDDLFECYTEFQRSMAPPLMHSIPQIGNRKLRDVDSSVVMSIPKISMKAKISSFAIQMEFVGDEPDNDGSASSRGVKLNPLITACKLPAQIIPRRVVKFGTPVNPLTLSHASLVYQKPTNPGISLSSSLRISNRASKFQSQGKDKPNRSHANLISKPNLPNSPHQPTNVQLSVSLDRGDFEYSSGDSIVVYPDLGEDVIVQLFSLFPDFDPGMIVQWNAHFTSTGHAGRTFHIPLDTPMTLRNVFSNLVDITASPDRQFIMNISSIVEEAEHEEILNGYAQDATRFKAWIRSLPNLRCLDVITLFPVKGTALDRLIEFLPTLQPQSFPISSHPDSSPKTVTFLVRGTSDIPAVAYLLRLSQKRKKRSLIYISLRKGKPLKIYQLPTTENNRKPNLLLFSRGSSVAPYLSCFSDPKRNSGFNIRVFHCFSGGETQSNYIFRNTVKTLEKSGAVKFDCFYPSKIAEVLKENEEDVWEFMNTGRVHVAGFNGNLRTMLDVSMCKVIESHCTPLVYRNSRSYAEAFLSQLQKNGNFQENWY